MTGARAGSEAVHNAKHYMPLVLLVAAGYYLGAQLGLALTFSPLPIAVLWPPNAILFAALLLVPTRSWWLVLGAAFPAHLLAELQSGIPHAMVLCWYLSNISEALIGATCVRYFVVHGATFDSALNVVWFTIAAVGAALLSSFIDSAFVMANGWGETPYWDLWASRSWANVTANLTVTPAIVTLAAVGLKGLRSAPSATRIEAGLLAGGLTLVTFLVFDTSLGKSVPTAYMYLPMPFLLWAAIRFGPVGASSAIATLALLAIWGAGHATGAMSVGSPLQNAHAVQLLLVFLGPTLLCLAAAMQERGRTEDSLRVSDARFKVMLEATRDSVYDYDRATDEMDWSGDGLARFGYPPAQGRPGVEEWRALIHPEDLPRVLAQHREIGSAQRFWDQEFRLRRADGTYAFVHERGSILRDAAEEPMRLIGTISDVSERRDADELHQRMAQVARLTAMGELAATIAHEINQPMSAILNNVDAAERLLDNGALAETELRAILEDIRRDDLRAGETVRHIRQLASRHPGTFAPFDVQEVIRGVVQIVTPLARRREVLLSAEYVACPPVHGDATQVQQVLLNLIINAMDAMAGIPARARHVTVGTWQNGAELQVFVSDRGHGIPDDKLEQIFESFYSTKGDGMGLGLSIARTIVHAHGAKIWAHNNADWGATVRFTLPLATPST